MLELYIYILVVLNKQDKSLKKTLQPNNKFNFLRHNPFLLNRIDHACLVKSQNIFIQCKSTKGPYRMVSTMFLIYNSLQFYTIFIYNMREREREKDKNKHIGPRSNI